jgi:hypothetical protein
MMFLTSSLVLITAALSAAVAVPLEQRACTTIQPTSIDVLNQATPNKASLGSQFTLGRINGNDNTIISTLTFENIPQGATGCMFNILIPALTKPNEIASGTATQANVWTVKPWTTSSPPTYNHPPVRNSFVATTIFPTGVTDSPFQTVLESNTCSPVVSFLLELSTWQTGSGFVNFANSPAIGFSLTYNC